VDAVREVDVGTTRRPEQDLGPRGEPDVGVTGGIVALVALGLDDGAAAAFEEEPAADQLTGDVVDRALEERPLEAPLGCLRGDLQERSSTTLALTAASVSRALSS
jgi:hypothetical protein